MIRVVVIAPALALRAGIRALLSADEDIEVVAEAAAFSDLESEGKAIIPPDVDIFVADPEAVEIAALAEFLEQADSSPCILLLTDDSQAAYDFSGLPLRAWGLLPLDASEEELLAAVHALYEGLMVADPALMQPLLGQIMLSANDKDTFVEDLTDRETEVLQLLAQGLANKQIALELDISAHTVKFHVSSIYTKLGVTNRTEAVTHGVRLGMIVL